MYCDSDARGRGRGGGGVGLRYTHFSSFVDVRLMANPHPLCPRSSHWITPPSFDSLTTPRQAVIVFDSFSCLPLLLPDYIHRTSTVPYHVSWPMFPPLLPANIQSALRIYLIIYKLITIIIIGTGVSWKKFLKNSTRQRGSEQDETTFVLESAAARKESVDHVKLRTEPLPVIVCNTAPS